MYDPLQKREYSLVGCRQLSAEGSGGYNSVLCFHGPGPTVPPRVTYTGLPVRPVGPNPADRTLIATWTMQLYGVARRPASATGPLGPKTFPFGLDLYSPRIKKFPTHITL